LKISIITPTYNSEKNIAACINSVLNQDYKNFEHIIVDNLSSDSTLQIVKDLYSLNNMIANLHIISEKDDGISDAFNKGITAAAGKIITILNSDDIYFSNNVFDSVLKAFSNPEVQFVHGNIVFKDDLYGTNVRKPLLCDIRKAMPYNHPTMFLRDELYKKIGLFDLKYKYAMDFDLICRLYKFYNKPEAISVYLNEEPLVVMNAGGASWSNEINSITETKQILIANNKWNFQSQQNYYFRLFRTKIKEFLNLFGLNLIVKIWRWVKWTY